MGLMRLKVNDWANLPEDRLARVFIASSDELPYAGHTFRSSDQLIIERRDDSSGCVWAPWSQGKLKSGQAVGEWLIGTATLMEREQPYQLEVELARGSVFRLRNQLAIWKQLGLTPTPELEVITADATRLFSQAATRQDNPAAAAELAAQALLAVAEGSIQLTEVYSKQAMAVRRSTVDRLPTLLGVGLNGEAPADGEPTKQIKEAFSSVVIRCAWNSVEATEGKRRWKAADAQVAWAQQAGMRIISGPLIEFCDQSIPDWAYLWEGDFEALLTLMIAHVETVVNRYRGRVQLWNVAGRINRRRVLGLSDEQRLQLVARAVRVVREADPKTPVIVSLDQPWGEYLTAEPSELAPIDFADALERADLGIAGFGLELNIGYAPDGTSPRNPLAFSRLLDYWSLRLELPLMLQLTTPSSNVPDEHAGGRGIVVAGGVGSEAASTIDPNYQAHWIDQCGAMLLAKNCVQVMTWNSLNDALPHTHPHAGLFDKAGQVKPALERLSSLRSEHLM